MPSQDVQADLIARPAGGLFNRWQHREPVCANIQRVLADALVNPGFCVRLLSCPAEAIKAYELTSAERHALATIRATTLYEFAAAVEAWRLAQIAGAGDDQRNSVDVLLSATA
jgi:hypothetical protein